MRETGLHPLSGLSSSIGSISYHLRRQSEVLEDCSLRATTIACWIAFRWAYLQGNPALQLRNQTPLDRESKPNLYRLSSCSQNFGKMSSKGVDLTVDGAQASTSISWHDPHPAFVIILVGPDEEPFGIQKDLLCAASPYYREEFESSPKGLELVVKLPETDADTFGCFQNFIFTGSVYNKVGGREIPDYPLLMNIWKLATKLKMAPLRVAVLDVMAERREKTSNIPGTPLLIQAWQETEEGSGLRLMLIQWAAEHMRTSPAVRNSFAKSLPQEILSELVIVMSDLPTPQPTPAVLPIHPSHHQHNHPPYPYPTEGEFELHAPRPSIKRSRKSDIGPMNGAADDAYEIKAPPKKIARRSEPGNIKPKARKPTNGSSHEIVPLSPAKELEFCRDMIKKMLSGPGYWTRLVGPFKDPVDPVRDNVPNYLVVVKRPMALRTIEDKMARNEYTSATEFEADVKLIFQNCYEYWTEKDPIFKQCEQFEKYFYEKWNERHKWTGPSIKQEAS